MGPRNPMLACHLVLALLMSLISSTHAAADNELASLINARLEHMRDVAAYKWINDVPIADEHREQVVLDAATQSAQRHGIVASGARSFFRAQIDAAKEIQNYWFSVWARGSGPVSAPDLATEIRPRLITLGDEIAALLPESRSRPELTEFAATLDVVGLSEAARDELWRTLSEIRIYPNRLTQVLDSGVLRVGTTFDYPPFSSRDKDAPVGIDIDLADDLARSLGVRAEYIQTTWPDLMADLGSGAFDIAMSGVSINLDRQRHGFFSQTYHSGGKTPISRCEQASLFDSLEAIDQKSVRVIVNPGGTNERFVDEHISRATKVLYPDNRSIFAALLEGSGDVMITDDIEVRLQTARENGLCATMSGRFLTRVEKGYLMPLDTPLKEYVNLWLSRRLTDGTVAETFVHHLGRN